MESHKIGHVEEGYRPPELLIPLNSYRPPSHHSEANTYWTQDQFTPPDQLIGLRRQDGSSRPPDLSTPNEQRSDTSAAGYYGYENLGRSTFQPSNQETAQIPGQFPFNNNKSHTNYNVRQEIHKTPYSPHYENNYNQHPMMPPAMNGVSDERCSYCPMKFNKKSEEYKLHKKFFHRHDFETCELEPGHKVASEKLKQKACPICFQHKKNSKEQLKCVQFHKDHEDTEVEPTEFKCQEKGCTLKYKTRKSLHAHCRSHHSMTFKIMGKAEWTEPCDFCGRKFRYERTKVKHELETCPVRPKAQLEAAKKGRKKRIRKPKVTSGPRSKASAASGPRSKTSAAGAGSAAGVGPRPHQPLGPPPNQPLGPPPNQPLGPPPHQPLGPPPHQPLGPPPHQPLGPPPNQPLGPPPHQPLGPRPHQPLGPPPHQPLGPPPHQPLGPPPHQALGPPRHQALGPTLQEALGPPPKQSLGLSGPPPQQPFGDAPNQALGDPPQLAFKPTHKPFSPPPLQTSPPVQQALAPPSQPSLGDHPFQDSSSSSAAVNQESFLDSIMTGKDYFHTIGESVSNFLGENPSISKTPSLRSHTSINSNDGLLGSQ